MKRNPPPPQDQGNLITVRVDSPAAGAEFELTVPAGRVWRLISLRCLLTTDATVQTRLTNLDFLDGSDIYLSTGSSGGVPASTNGSVTLAPGTPPFNASATDLQWLGAPNNLLLRPGDIIRSRTENIVAADQYSQIVLRVEEWVEA